MRILSYPLFRQTMTPGIWYGLRRRWYDVQSRIRARLRAGKRCCKNLWEGRVMGPCWYHFRVAADREGYPRRKAGHGRKGN